MILDYLLLLIDDSRSPDDWLDIQDKQPMENVFEIFGVQARVRGEFSMAEQKKVKFA